MTSGRYQVDAETISDYQRDGAVCIRGAFTDWVETIAAGIERNMRDRSAAGSDLVQDGQGRFLRRLLQLGTYPRIRESGG